MSNAGTSCVKSSMTRFGDTSRATPRIAPTAWSRSPKSVCSTSVLEADAWPPTAAASPNANQIMRFLVPSAT